jgi:hypothetical protein
MLISSFFYFVSLLILEEWYKLLRPSLCRFLQAPVNFSSAQIFLSAPSDIPRLCSFLNIRDKVSPPYRITGKVIAFFILIFTFFDRREDKNLTTAWSVLRSRAEESASRYGGYSRLYISSRRQPKMVILLPVVENCFVTKYRERLRAYTEY